MVVSQQQINTNVDYKIDLKEKEICRRDMFGEQFEKINLNNFKKVRKILSDTMIYNLGCLKNMEGGYSTLSTKHEKQRYNKLKQENYEIIRFMVKEKLYLR